MEQLLKNILWFVLAFVVLYFVVDWTLDNPSDAREARQTVDRAASSAVDKVDRVAGELQH